MLVVEYLKKFGVEALREEFKVVVKEYDKLLVLNYDQIYSPKNEITNECRGLILEKGTFNVVSRSFDRFFNLGENNTEINDISQCYVMEKVDGSLIKIYFYDGKWEISTRGTAYAESSVNGFPITFRELVLKALGFTEGEFQMWGNNNLDEDLTFICEIVSIENRVVTRYPETKLYHLATRNNRGGEYYIGGDLHEINQLIEVPKHFSFNSEAACLNTAKSLPNLEEGYVVYDNSGNPFCKIKSPAYVAVHAIRGEGLTPKRIAQLVLMNEQNEYLAYFPEDESYFVPFEEALWGILTEIETYWEKSVKDKDQKEFALSVKDSLYSCVLFHMKKKALEDAEQAFHEQRENWKIDALCEFVNKL